MIHMGPGVLSMMSKTLRWCQTKTRGKHAKRRKGRVKKKKKEKVKKKQQQHNRCLQLRLEFSTEIGGTFNVIFSFSFFCMSCSFHLFQTHEGLFLILI